MYNSVSEVIDVSMSLYSQVYLIVFLIIECEEFLFLIPTVIPPPFDIRYWFTFYFTELLLTPVKAPVEELIELFF
jgi:hypothetical protein